MLNFKSLARKYDLTQKDFDSIYQSCYYKTVSRVGMNDLQDYLYRYLNDSLEEMELDARDIESICNYYIFDLPKIKEEEELEEEAQTSGSLSAAIGQNRKKNPKFNVTNLYK